MSAEYIKVGEITGASGLRGDLRIRSFTRPDTEIFDLQGWILSPDLQQEGGQRSDRRSVDPNSANRVSQCPPAPIVIRSGRRQGKYLVVSLKGVDDRDAAEALIGLSIKIEADAMPDPDPGQYYWDQLVGLRVRNLVGDDLGTIDHLVETGANDVLVVRSGPESSGQVAGDAGGNESRERLLPWVDSVVIEVDLEHGRMTVDWDSEF